MEEIVRVREDEMWGGMVKVIESEKMVGEGGGGGRVGGVM